MTNEDQKEAPEILGIHHITAIAGNPQKNIEFYTGFLGLRLVKLTVNFDDPTTYHFYYGDGIGNPGTILTFFPWQHMPRGYQGTGQVVTTSFLIAENAIEYWINRLKSHGISYTGPTNRFDNDEQVVTFYDPDGMEVELVAHKVAEERTCYRWTRGPIPKEYATRGFYSATISLVGYEHTASILTKEMGFTKTKHEGSRFRFEIKNKEYNDLIDNNDKNEGKKSKELYTSSPSTIDLVCLPYTKRGIMGVGSVHHIAWRTLTDESQIRMRKKIISAGLDPTPVIDRTYFHSVYFREPGGVLFEIATDPPGFTVDQRQEELGQKLLLPAWLETQRKNLERILPKVNVPSLDQFLNSNDKKSTENDRENLK